VHDAPGGVLVLGSSPWGTTNVTFADNEVAWRAGTSAPAVALAFDGTSVSPARSAFEVSGISVHGNRITLPDRSPHACAVYANWAPGAPVTDITVRDNELTNIGLTTCGPQADQLAVG
jgi:hypothetical protein